MVLYVHMDNQEKLSLLTYENSIKLERGPMPNVMAAQPNTGGALCKSSVIPFLVPLLKVWLTPVAGVPCSNAANIGECKTWTQSELCTGQNSIRRKSTRKCIV